MLPKAVIDQSAKLLEDFRVITDADTLKTLRVSRPLLHSCVAIDGIIQVSENLKIRIVIVFHILSLSESCTMRR